jgi:hypothetical protein
MVIALSLVFTLIVFATGLNLRALSEGVNRPTHQNPICTDFIWCNISAPLKSYFGFNDEIDATSWSLAKLQAKSGEQVLLKKVIEHFPHYLDFLDGDTRFRKLHFLADFFIDKQNDLTPLISDHVVHGGKKMAQTVGSKVKVLERNNDFYFTKRAPIVKAGYTAFARPGSLFYGGPEIGKAVVTRATLLEHWRKVRDRVTRPFVMLDAHDGDWGLLSTQFPQRTANWGKCCTVEETSAIYEFLDHNMTLMLVVNQHHNFSHPKIVTLPRGLPAQAEHSNRLIWDTMRAVLRENILKSGLVTVPGSSSGYRPLILHCMKARFSSSDFTVSSGPRDRSATEVGTLAERRAYYTGLAAARVGFPLPGAGYDTYR